jgi:prepilin-type processing-associated H-X9-DG protein
MSIFTDVFVESDDNTYLYGDRYFKALSVDGVLREPYYLKDNDEIIAFYPSQDLFVVYVNSNIVNVIYTMTCWSDDYAKYSFVDGVLTELFETSHGGRSVTVSFVDGVASSVVFGWRKFGSFAVGRKAPNFDDFFVEYAISKDIVEALGV